MSTLFPLINIAAIVIGLITVLVIIRLYLKTRYKYVLTYTFHVSLFNIVLILFLPVNYFFNALEVGFNDSLIRQILLFMFYFSINLLKYLWGYTFLLKTVQLLNTRIPKAVHGLFFLAAVPSLGLFAYTFYQAMHFENIRGPRKISEWITFQMLAAILISMLYLIRFAKKRLSQSRRTAVNRYYIPWMVVIGGVMSSAFVSLFIPLPRLALINMTIVYLSFNLMPLLIFTRFVRNFKEPFSPSPLPSGDLETRYVRYGITRREKEILQLIIAGNSNQEIADALFISLATVKDHIHNLFRKTEVKSRVQLSNLFR